MIDHLNLTRRDANKALLATAFAVLGGRVVAARASTPLFDFAIAGGNYHGLRTAVRHMEPGMKLALVREPANPYDANAVAVYMDGLKLGFVPRAANRPVAALLDRGQQVRAEVVRTLDVQRASNVPKELVFTGFSSGDPVVRLTTEAQA